MLTVKRFWRTNSSNVYKTIKRLKRRAHLIVCFYVKLTSVFLQVSPGSGPLEGGTLVTLDGVDLSIKYADVMNITVAGYACDVQPTLYRVSTRYSFGCYH